MKIYFKSLLVPISPPSSKLRSSLRLYFSLVIVMHELLSVTLSVLYQIWEPELSLCCQDYFWLIFDD